MSELTVIPHYLKRHNGPKNWVKVHEIDGVTIVMLGQRRQDGHFIVNVSTDFGLERCGLCTFVIEFEGVPSQEEFDEITTREKAIDAYNDMAKQLLEALDEGISEPVLYNAE